MHQRYRTENVMYSIQYRPCEVKSTEKVWIFVKKNIRTIWWKIAHWRFNHHSSYETAHSKRFDQLFSEKIHYFSYFVSMFKFAPHDMHLSNRRASSIDSQVRNIFHTTSLYREPSVDIQDQCFREKNNISPNSVMHQVWFARSKRKYSARFIRLVLILTARRVDYDFKLWNFEDFDNLNHWIRSSWFLNNSIHVPMSSHYAQTVTDPQQPLMSMSVQSVRDFVGCYWVDVSHWFKSDDRHWSTADDSHWSNSDDRHCSRADDSHWSTADVSVSHKHS